MRGTRQLYTSDTPARPDGRNAGLSERELQVMYRLSQGHTPEMVGRILGISGNTVKTHSERARFKLMARNTTEACVELVRAHII